MTWQEVRAKFPDQWLLIEAINAHSQNGKRIIDAMQIAGMFSSGTEAWQAYETMHKNAPQKEFFSVHTSKEQLEIQERFWLGVLRSA